jgi:hypothetical protein
MHNCLPRNWGCAKMLRMTYKRSQPRPHLYCMAPFNDLTKYNYYVTPQIETVKEPYIVCLVVSSLLQHWQRK